VKPAAAELTIVTMTRRRFKKTAELGFWSVLKLQSRPGDWRARMLETIAIILIVLWLLGIVSGYTMGNFIYILLVIAIVLFLVRLVGGRTAV